MKLIKKRYLKCRSSIRFDQMFILFFISFLLLLKSKDGEDEKYGI